MGALLSRLLGSKGGSTEIHPVILQHTNGKNGETTTVHCDFNKGAAALYAAASQNLNIPTSSFNLVFAGSILKIGKHSLADTIPGMHLQ